MLLYTEAVSLHGSSVWYDTIAPTRSPYVCQDESLNRRKLSHPMAHNVTFATVPPRDVDY